MPVVLGGIIETAISLGHADFGIIQRLGPDGRLKIVAQRGFPDWWIDYLDSLANAGGVCGIALAKGERVVVEDVAANHEFAAAPGLEMLRLAGVRATQCTPMRGSSGQLLGVLSTHCRTPQRPAAQALKVLDMLAAHGAAAIERDDLAAALRASDERFRLVMDAAEEGLWDWRLGDGEIYCNPGFARMLGYEPAEMDRRISNWVALLHADEAATVVEDARRRLVRCGHFSLEFQLRRKDGSYCTVHSRGKVVEHDAAGNPLRAVGSCIDLGARERADKALRAGEERLRLLIEQAPVALAMLDRELRYLAVSRRWREDYALGEQEIVGRSHYAVFPDISEAWKSVHRRALAGETVRSEEDRFVLADGKEQWLRWEVLPWRAAAGTVGGILIYSENITARKHSDEALRESESRFRRAQAAAKVGTWEWAVGSDRNQWSDETFRLFGLQPGAVVPSYAAWLACVSPPDRAGAAAKLADCVARAEEFEIEWRAACHGGPERWLLGRGQPEFDATGALARYLGIVMDISESKRASQALEQTRNRLAEAQKIAHLGSFEYTPGTATTVWSDEQYRIHGLEPGHPSPSLDQILERFVLPEDAEALRREFFAAIAGQCDIDCEHRLLRQDGEVRWVHTLARPELDHEGKLLRYVGTTMDITQRKREQHEAQKQSEQMHAMARHNVAVQTAAAFAHELNQPLVSIVAYNEVALGAVQNGEMKADTLARALTGSREQALRAGQVLHELIDHLHTSEAEPRPFDLNIMVEEAITRLRKTEIRSFLTALDLERELPQVRGNRMQTEKVLLNLIQNGLDAMDQAAVAPATFVIAVRTLAGRKMAHLTLRDGGPGVDAEIARRIFDPFFSTKSNGLGLGLAISRSLIEAQGGQLWLDPEDGPGAVFHFTLPFDHEET
ncbi:MAG: PAS domain-containing protein [Rhodocyclaceae bacterium]|nr:PAS domain-containing protein [Rhodocyclaceae bacterium]